MGKTIRAGPQGQPMPFQYRLTSNFGTTREVAVEVTQISGPPAVITPRIQAGRPRFVRDFFVALGPQAGRIVLRAQASVPRLPFVTYTIVATGGIPVSLESELDAPKPTTRPSTE